MKECYVQGAKQKKKRKKKKEYKATRPKRENTQITYSYLSKN
jgi:hypothetical protein